MNTENNNIKEKLISLKLVHEFMGKPFGLTEFLITYSSDWNLLMQVIKEIGNKTGFTLVMEENTSYWCNNGEYITDEPEFGGYGDISNIYEAVVDFLKWHNSQQNG